MSYKSKEDFIVKHLERREFVKCGCHKRWSYWGFGTGNYSNICPLAVKCDFDVISEMNSLERIYKKQLSQQILYDIISNSILGEENGNVL